MGCSRHQTPIRWVSIIAGATHGPQAPSAWVALYPPGRARDRERPVFGRQILANRVSCGLSMGVAPNSCRGGEASIGKCGRSHQDTGQGDSDGMSGGDRRQQSQPEVSLADGAVLRFATTAMDIKALTQWLCVAGVTRAVCEPTGGYKRPAVASLHAVGLRMVMAHATRGRAFARPCGTCWAVAANSCTTG